MLAATSSGFVVVSGRAVMSTIPTSSVLHSLPSPLLQLCLSLTLPTSSLTLYLIRIRRSPRHHASHACLESTVSGPGTPDTVDRHNRVDPPAIVAHQRHQDNCSPGPVQDIPHEFRQTFRIEVLASSLELSVNVRGSCYAFEPELNGQCRGIEEEVEEETASSEDEEAEKEVEGVDGERDLVRAIERGRVGLRLGFERFLLCTVSGRCEASIIEQRLPWPLLK